MSTVTSGQQDEAVLLDPMAPAPTVRYFTYVDMPKPSSVNVFSSAEYLGCVAEAFFPHRPYEIADFSVAGSVYRLLRLARTGMKRERVVTWVPFLDFLEPITEPGVIAEGGPHYLPAVSHGRVTAAEWHARPADPAIQMSPLIDFSLFPTWEAFVAHSRAQTHAGFRSNRARAVKKLHEQHGLEFRWNDADPGALHQLIEWKSQQYQAAGFVDGFASPALRRVFELLRERKKLIVTTMRLGNVIVAGHAGLEHDGRFYYWLPAYDKAWGKDGVGSMMIEWMMEQSYALKHSEFDFLLGNETYKWGYATHTRMIGPVGSQPIRDRVWQPLRALVMTEVRKHDAVYKRLQDLKRRVSYLRLRSGRTKF